MKMPTKIRRNMTGEKAGTKGEMTMKYKIAAALSAALGVMVFLSSCIVAPDTNAAGTPPAAHETIIKEPTYVLDDTGYCVTVPVITEPQHPFSGKEVAMMAQTIYKEAQVLSWRGECWGMSYKARQAAVGWCILNRYDAGFGETLVEVMSEPKQFAWREDAPITEEMLLLAQDVMGRWWAEKQGVQNSGRTLPSDYLFFEGDGRENYFRKEFESTGEFWDWSLPDPYKEAEKG